MSAHGIVGVSRLEVRCDTRQLAPSTEQHQTAPTILAGKSMETVLAIATLLGGISAIWYFRNEVTGWRAKNRTHGTEPGTPVARLTTLSTSPKGSSDSSASAIDALSTNVTLPRTRLDLKARAELEVYDVSPSEEGDLVTCQRGEVTFPDGGRVDVEFVVPFLSRPHVEVIDRAGNGNIPVVEEVSRYRVGFRRKLMRPVFSPGVRKPHVFGWTAEGAVLRRAGDTHQ